MMDNAEFFKKQLKNNVRLLKIAQMQMDETNNYIENSISSLKGEDRDKMIELKKGISSAFEKAENGDMSFNLDLEELKNKLSNYTENGSSSNGQTV